MSVHSTEEKFLLYLKTNGAQSTGTIGKALDMTSEAARQQLTKLEEEGKVKSTRDIKGVGRPTKVWKLTQFGHAQFPDAHSKLTVQLISQIRDELGEESLQKIITANQKDQLAKYRTVIDHNTGLEERVSKLADIRCEEGYMAEWKKDKNDFLLIENHCPICAAAEVCQGFCQAELETFKEVLGEDINIYREEHIQTGARRCAYRISKRG